MLILNESIEINSIVSNPIELDTDKDSIGLDTDKVSTGTIKSPKKLSPARVLRSIQSRDRKIVDTYDVAQRGGLLAFFKLSTEVCTHHNFKCLLSASKTLEWQPNIRVFIQQLRNIQEVEGDYTLRFLKNLDDHEVFVTRAYPVEYLKYLAMLDEERILSLRCSILVEYVLRVDVEFDDLSGLIFFILPHSLDMSPFKPIVIHS